MKMLQSMIVCLALIVTTPLAQANRIHLKGKLPLSIEDVGSRLLVSGQIAGIGQLTTFLRLRATAIVSTVCFNPGEKRDPVPGQDSEVELSGNLLLLPGEETKNGWTSFDIYTKRLDPLESSACPNSQWTPMVAGVCAAASSEPSAAMEYTDSME